MTTCVLDRDGPTLTFTGEGELFETHLVYEGFQVVNPPLEGDVRDVAIGES